MKSKQTIPTAPAPRQRKPKHDSLTSGVLVGISLQASQDRKFRARLLDSLVYYGGDDLMKELKTRAAA